MAEKPKQDPTPAIQPDSVLVPGDAGNQAIDMLDRHKNLVIIVVAATAVAIIGGLIISELKKQASSEAAQAFSSAAKERSTEDLDAVVSEHPDTLAAGNAVLTKADLLQSQQKFEDAKIAFMTFVEKFPDHPRHPQGLYALGNLSHSNGDFEGAIEFYDRAMEAAPDGDLGPLLLIRKGDIALSQAESLREAGKTEEADAQVDAAKQLYEESITRPEFRASPFISLAESRLDLADIGQVPVVPAPPEPEPEPESAIEGASPTPLPGMTPVPAPVKESQGAAAPTFSDDGGEAEAPKKPKPPREKEENATEDEAPTSDPAGAKAPAPGEDPAPTPEPEAN